MGIYDTPSVSALIRVIDDWSHALDEGHEVCVLAIFFDVWKAFDRVPYHAITSSAVATHES